MSKLTPLLLLMMACQVLNSGVLQECFKKKVSCKKDSKCKQVCQDRNFKKGKCRRQHLPDCPVDQPWGCMCYGKIDAPAPDPFEAPTHNLTHVPFSSQVRGTCSSCCEELILNTANPETKKTQGPRLGKYIKTEFCLNDFPVYKQESGSRYIFRMVGRNQWIVGSQPGQRRGGIYAQDRSSCPDEIPSWKYHNGNSWKRDGTLKATCTGDCKCGLAKRTTRIVGGQVTEVNEYPWQVGIVWKNESSIWCGGSLISNRWILSAAHCMCSNHAHLIQVLLGEHDYLSSSETTEVRMDIEKIIEHGGRHPKTYDYDFTLLKMKTAINFADYPHIRPICLPENDSKDYNDVVATVTGWGKTSLGGNSSNELREVDVKVLTNNECNSAYNNSITARMLCAEEAGGNGGKDACQGDSGGPLVTSDTGDGVTPGQNYELIGVVSWGDGCGDAGVPGVYARVTSVLSWIKINSDVLWNNCPRT